MRTPIQNQTTDRTVLALSALLIAGAGAALFLGAPTSVTQANAGVESRAVGRAPLDRAESAPWQYVVIDHSGTRRDSLTSMAAEAKRLETDVPWHFVVGNGTESPAGALEVGERWRTQSPGAALHDPGYDAVSISVCLVGDYNEETPAAESLDTLARLCAVLVRRHSIPLSHVTTHYGMVPWMQSPGRNFDILELRDRVADLLAERTPPAEPAALDGAPW